MRTETKKELKKETTRRLTEAGVIAALYAALTLLLPVVSFGPLQFRLSEILTVLPAFTVAAVPGLTVGCLLANGFGLALGANLAGAWDLLVGTSATLIAALLAYALRRVRFRRVPVWSALPAVVLNTGLVGAELWFAVFSGEAAALPLCLAQVGLGELVTAGVGGVLLAWTLCRTGAEKRIFGAHPD